MAGGRDMIQVKGVSKKFRDELVLHKIDLEVKDGEIVGLVGPNGAGKTTLLNIIARIWLPSEGEVYIDGANITQSKDISQVIGYVPETPFLYPKLTGREFLLFVGALYRLSNQNLKNKIYELERALEISFWMDQLMESFPRGVRQKMNLAAMLLHSPKILLLDEPTANLDPKSARLIKDLLKNLAEKGISILLSTHILEIAEKLSQRLIILDRGRVVAEGTIEDLRNLTKKPDYNLEEIFLQITGGKAYTELLKILS